MSAAVSPVNRRSEVRPFDVEALKAEARRSPLRRARICLHASHEDQVQEMVIAFCRDSYVRPHRHRHTGESFHLVDGCLEVVLFTDEGSVESRVRLEAGGAFLFRLSRQAWHTVIPLSECAVVHEVTPGPFRRELTDFAPWSPAVENAEGIRDFLARIASGGQTRPPGAEPGMTTR
ncbi:MAG: WbuC family cupin fold metalloprotein [Candidatus Methylomirabilia bacterium]